MAGLILTVALLLLLCSVLRLSWSMERERESE